VLLDGLALLATDGRAAAAGTLQQAAKSLTTIPVKDVLRWGWAATGASNAVWDDEATHVIAARQVRLVRDAGALAELPIHLAALGLIKAWMGDFAGAGSLIEESDSVAAATGSPIAPYTLLRLRSLQGSEAEASTLIAGAIERDAAGGQGLAAAWAHWAAAVLYNGLGRYEEAASAGVQATSNAFEPWVSMWALYEVVEAAARGGNRELASDALKRLKEATHPCRTDFALGIEARSRALLSEGEAAERLYQEAIDRLDRTQLRPERARAHLLYGEWLRRENRLVDARRQLHCAYEQFTSIGMEGFAERARSELLATGAKVRRRRVEKRDDLTAQERQIARLARDDVSNRHRRAAIPQPAHRRVAPAQRVLQAGHPLPLRAPERAARIRLRADWRRRQGRLDLLAVRRPVTPGTSRGAGSTPASRRARGPAARRVAGYASGSRAW
jgi:tetratricopeptide (TPR) repeat protein